MFHEKPYIYDVQAEGREGVLHVFTDSINFKQ